MTTKVMLKWAGVLVCALGIRWGAQGASATIEMGTLAPRNSSYEKALRAMANAWARAPGGGVELKIFAGGVIGSESDMVREMRGGGIQAALLTTAGLSDIERSVIGLQNLPVTFQSYDEWEYVRTRIQPELERRIEAQGFKVLFWADAGWIYFFSKNPIRTPDDVRREKLFVWAGSPGIVKIFKDAGFNPVSLEPADAVLGLKQGIVTVMPTPPIYALTSRIDQSAPYMLDLKWALLMGAAVIEMDAWRGLPDEAKPSLEKAAEATGRLIIQKGREESDAAVEAMKTKRGLQVIPASDSLAELWLEEVGKTQEQMRGTIVPEDIYDQVQGLIKEYRSR